MQAQKDLRCLANKKIAEHSLRFFKTGRGEYGEGDIFLGVRVPVIRKIARKYRGVSLSDCQVLVQSKYHEERLLGLIILTLQYDQAARAASKENDKASVVRKAIADQKRIFDFYVKNFRFVNNWDLVDVTCPPVVGRYLFMHGRSKERPVLRKWAKSKHLWTRRIAMMCTHWFIRQGEIDHALEIADLLLQDKHDLIHKVVGWMIREAAKVDFARVERFLKPRYARMPRTMLRYAIERFPETKRQRYLKGTI